MQAIEAYGLGFRYGKREVVTDIHLTLPVGRRMGLLGPNGAGKSTLIALLTGLLPPRSGSVQIFGKSPAALARPRPFGLVAQEAALFPELTVQENLQFFARMAGVPRREEKHHLAWALGLAALEEHGNRPAGALSGGMKRRLHVASALLHRPRLLILDEPTEGVDPQSRLHIHRLLLHLNREEGLSLLVTSHHLEEIERLCEDVLILDHGRMLAGGPLDDLLKSRGGSVVRMGCGQPLRLRNLLLERGLPSRLEEGDVQCSLPQVTTHLPPLLEEIAQAGIVLERLEVHPPSLESLFFDLTGSQLRDEEEVGA